MTSRRGADLRPRSAAARATSRLGVALLVAGAALAPAACGDDDGGDEVAFCDAVASLREGDPFAELELATPAEMRGAFDDLAAGAERIADAAPEDVAVQADRYRDAVGALRDELAGGAYDPRRVDGRRYARAVEDYTTAAGSLDNAADARC